MPLSEMCMEDTVKGPSAPFIEPKSGNFSSQSWRFRIRIRKWDDRLMAKTSWLARRNGRSGDSGPFRSARSQVVTFLPGRDASI